MTSVPRTLVNKLGRDGLVMHGINRVMKVRIAFQMSYVLDRAGREIIYNINIVATLKVGVREMRADKASASRDQYSQN
jgi:hypothetical protein